MYFDILFKVQAEKIDYEVAVACSHTILSKTETSSADWVNRNTSLTIKAPKYHENK
jgi:hypothetical protein